MSRYSGIRHGSPDARVLQCLLYRRSSPADNHYAHPRAHGGAWRSNEKARMRLLVASGAFTSCFAALFCLQWTASCFTTGTPTSEAEGCRSTPFGRELAGSTGSTAVARHESLHGTARPLVWHTACVVHRCGASSLPARCHTSPALLQPRPTGSTTWCSTAASRGAPSPPRSANRRTTTWQPPPQQRVMGYSHVAAGATVRFMTLHHPRPRPSRTTTSTARWWTAPGAPRSSRWMWCR